jgi:hypothetical protein
MAAQTGKGEGIRANHDDVVCAQTIEAPTDQIRGVKAVSGATPDATTYNE